MPGYPGSDFRRNPNIGTFTCERLSLKISCLSEILQHVYCRTFALSLSLFLIRGKKDQNSHKNIQKPRNEILRKVRHFMHLTPATVIL